jgi:hypothetical protein
VVPLTCEGVREEKYLLPLAGIELRTFQTVSYSLYQLMTTGLRLKATSIVFLNARYAVVMRNPTEAQAITLSYCAMC